MASESHKGTETTENAWLRASVASCRKSGRWRPGRRTARHPPATAHPSRPRAFLTAMERVGDAAGGFEVRPALQALLAVVLARALEVLERRVHHAAFADQREPVLEPRAHAEPRSVARHVRVGALERHTGGVDL